MAKPKPFSGQPSGSRLLRLCNQQFGGDATSTNRLSHSLQVDETDTSPFLSLIVFDVIVSFITAHFSTGGTISKIINLSLKSTYMQCAHLQDYFLILLAMYNCSPIISPPPCSSTQTNDIIIMKVDSLQCFKKIFVLFTFTKPLLCFERINIKESNWAVTSMKN